MEKAGRGSVLMAQQCRESDLPDPVWFSDDKLGVTVTFRAPQATPQATPQVEELIRATCEEQTREELQLALELSDREHFRKNYLSPALEFGLLERTIPEKPTSPNQRYKLTAKGKQLKSMLEKKNK